MNFQIGFWVVLAVCICALVATATLAVLYARKSNTQNAVQTATLQGGPQQNNTNVHPYLRTHAAAMFADETFQSPAMNTALSKSLALVSNFHNEPPHKTIASLKQEGKVVFVIDGEPNSLVDATQADLVITTKLQHDLIPSPSSGVPSLYLPYYVSFLHECKIDPNLLIKQPGPVRVPPEFAVFCYSNNDQTFPGVKARNDFYSLMQKRTNNRVANAGKVLADKPHAGKGMHGSHITNRELFANFKFVIAFENKQIQGYVTEKLVNPFLAGSIPIYFGAPDVNKHFNPKRFINVNNFANFDACIDEVLRLDTDNDAYAAMLREPCLIGNKLDQQNFALFFGGQFYNELYYHVPKNIKVRPSMVTANNVRLVTFADGKNYCTSRIVREGKDSGYFDECTGFGPSDLPEQFSDKFGSFIRANKRGFGYWIWKPVVVQMALKEAEENDLVVYCDSGCSIVPNFDHKMLEYYRVLLHSGNHDVLAFQMKHKACHWTKGDVFQAVGVEMDEHALQLTASVLLVRKTSQSVALIDDWAKLTQENLRNLTDEPSLKPNHLLFQAHRHDQSVWDLVARGRKHQGLFISNDNFMDSPGMQVPLLPSRKRK